MVRELAFFSLKNSSLSISPSSASMSKICQIVLGKRGLAKRTLDCILSPWDDNMLAGTD